MPAADRAPRYRQLADALGDRIRAGELAEGAALPTELALCAAHGVSRFTVREALKRLEADGLIHRRRGSGSVVERGGGGALRQSLTDLRDLLQYASGSRFEFGRLADGPLPSPLAARLGVGGRWAHLRGLRARAGEARPIAAADVFIHPDLAPHVDRLAAGRETLFRQLERLAGIRVTRTEQDIMAVAAGAREAALLGVARRAPCLRITRVYIDSSGRPLEISVSVHPGERFTYSMHIDH